MIPQFRVTGYLPPGIHKATLREKDFDFESPEALRLQRAKAVFNIHLVPLLEEMQSEIRSWTDFFGHDRERRPRGLVEVII